MIVSPILSVYVSSSNSEIKKNLKCENIPIWNEEEIMKKRFEEGRKRVQPIYDIKGKIIEYSDFGRHLDFTA
jgi:hypothetical protein